MTVRALLLALAAVLLGAAPAGAAELSLRVTPAAGVRLGNELRATGRVTEQGAAVAGRRVALELRRHPFTRRWRRGPVTVTGPDGRFSFPVKPCSATTACARGCSPPAATAPTSRRASARSAASAWPTSCPRSP